MPEMAYIRLVLMLAGGSDVDGVVYGVVVVPVGDARVVVRKVQLVSLYVLYGNCR